MAKRSTNLNRWRKASGADAVADLMQRYGITAADLREYQKREAGTTRKITSCPRCGKGIEVEVNLYDGSTTCPVCENDIIVPV